MIGSFPAHFTYAFSGHLHGNDASGRPRVAGTFRETVTYNGQTCTSSDVFFWNALRDTAQATVAGARSAAGQLHRREPAEQRAAWPSTSPPTRRACRT